MTIPAARLLDDAQLLRTAERLRPDRDPIEVAARIAWTVLVEPGDGVAGALIGACGAVEALQIITGEGLIDPGLVDGTAFSEAMKRWQPRMQQIAVREAALSAAQIGAAVLMPGDDAWPQGLDDLGAHAPLLLWGRGDMSALRADRTVAIVGARASTSYGENVAGELAGDLAGQGALIVSGGAYGIDGAAHRAAIGVGGSTIAFLAGGVDRAYPVGHQQLFERIRSAGAVLSEVPCGSAPTKWRFLARNRMIAAASLATVVVEAGWRSGTLNTAAHAADLGRPIGAVPGPITSAASAGCHRLLREFDAVCVTTAHEVRELWGESSAAEAAPPPPDRDQTRLLDALSTRAPRDTLDLARRSGLSEQRVRSLLGLLDLDGVVAQRTEGWIRTG